MGPSSTRQHGRAGQAAAPTVAPVPVRNVLIVGAGERGVTLAEQLERHPLQPRHVVGFVDDEPHLHHGRNGFRVLGPTTAVLELARRLAVDEVVVAYAPSWPEHLLQTLVATGEEHRIRVKALPGLYDAVVGGRPAETVADIPLLDLTGTPPSPLYEAGKRVTDVALAAGLLGLTAPIVSAAALAVVATSPGPALFRQRRVGRHGREFTMLKLRTMVCDAEARTGPVLATPQDARVTAVGRWLRATRVDELPQLVNVLRGDMSLVGPRPERPEFVADFARRLPGYLKRLEVRPGITGLAQVYGGYGTSVYDKLKYDWIYTYQRSWLLDLQILWRTVGVVVGRRGR
jgi:exopolysaccharide biosynthesis polyprenyl glycosylphosphotransferase